MTAHVLIVEDEGAFVEAIQQVLRDLSPGSLVTVARSRDSAFAILDSDFFDIIILDLNIPTADGLLDADPQHGFAVFGRAQSVASGTPIFVLTGSSAEDFIPNLLRSARQLDVWGEGRNTGTVRSGSTNLNSEISGNSGDNALTAMVRQTGVFHGQAEEEGRRCQTCTQAAHRRIQSAGGTCRVARGQNNDAVVSGI